MFSPKQPVLISGKMNVTFEPPTAFTKDLYKTYF